MTRALIANMVTGVSSGFERVLEVEGVGYRADMDGKTLVMHLGYSHPIRVEPPASCEFVVEDRGHIVRIRGIDKQSSVSWPRTSARCGPGALQG